jgi:hypothetical protein
MKSAVIGQFLKDPSVVFDKEKHTYKTAGGELYTGCTTIAGAWDKSYFLGPWHAKEMALAILSRPFDEVAKLTPPEFEKFITNAKGAAKRKSEAAANTGTLAHDWIASFISSRIDPNLDLIPTPDDDEANNAIEAFVTWQPTERITWLASEELVCSDEYRIAGTLDAIASFDGIPFIVDFKTSGQLSPSYLLQCAGYDIMLREMGFAVAGYKIIRIPKDGTAAETLTITDAKDMQFFRETFLKQREAHRFYVYTTSKFTDMATGKMRVDLPELKVEETN